VTLPVITIIAWLVIALIIIWVPNCCVFLCYFHVLPSCPRNA